MEMKRNRQRGRLRGREERREGGKEVAHILVTCSVPMQMKET